MFHVAASNRAIRTQQQFQDVYCDLARRMLDAFSIDRGEVHAQKTTSHDEHMKEILHLQLVLQVPQTRLALQSIVEPNLPWAEDHFKERISGQPLNPPPSEQWWPFAQRGNEKHKSDEKFSHTYPERFWPRFANEGGTMKHSRRIAAVPHVGLRFEYGDYEDLLSILRKNPRSRQAYLPIWFPEDLNAANHGERVPCTLGYHFLLTQTGRLDMWYPMRSCDMVRFMRDDIYMAARLLQHTCTALDLPPGDLVMNVANLHTFVGDEQFLLNYVREHQTPVAPRLDRSGYDFGALS